MVELKLSQFGHWVSSLLDWSPSLWSLATGKRKQPAALFISNSKLEKDQGEVYYISFLFLFLVPNFGFCFSTKPLLGSWHMQSERIKEIRYLKIQAEAECTFVYLLLLAWSGHLRRPLLFYIRAEKRMARRRGFHLTCCEVDELKAEVSWFRIFLFTRYIFTTKFSRLYCGCMKLINN